MSIDLDQLETAAKATTPGPWVIDPRNCDIVIRYADAGDVAEAQRISNAGNDAYYIAAANPAAVLALIAELRQARAERDWLAARIHHDGYSNCPSGKTIHNCKVLSCKNCWLNAAREAVEGKK